MSKLEEYLNQDIYNPKYLFHGSSLLLKQLEPMQSHDTYNKENEDNAVFLSSCFKTSAAYVFSRRLKEINKRGYDFNMNNNGKFPFMSFAVDNLSEDLFGYVYVFNITNDMIKDDKQNTTQYRCYHSLIPDDIVTIKYSDYEEYFERLSHEEFKKKFPKR